MDISLITTLTFSIPSTIHTGEASLLLDLSHSLVQRGHSVTVYGVEGSEYSDGVQFVPCPLAGMGQSEPSVESCEKALIAQHRDALLGHEIVHDFSNNKLVATLRAEEGRPHIQTFLGAPYNGGPATNCCVQSAAQAERAKHGRSDYFGTHLAAMGGPPSRPINARVVHDGIDCDYYCPGDTPKEDFFLWIGRWSPVRGYAEFIQIAEHSPDLRFIMAGARPEDETFDSEKSHAAKCAELAKGVPNLELIYLPPDPDHHDAKRELYRRAKAILFPVQFQEPFGLGQIEAMACGTPAISPPLGAYPEVSEHIFPVDLHDPFTTDLERTRRLFSREAMAARYEQAYLDVLTGQGWG